MSLVERVRGGGSAAGEPLEFLPGDFLRMRGHDRMPPFLMSIPSDSDLWMFVSSTGGLTAGRRDPDGSLFPYITEDELHDAPASTGPVTLLRVRREGGPEVLWEPFRGNHPDVERRLAKHVLGTPVVFEEVHHGLGLTFRYAWGACDAFGHVRSATLLEERGEPVTVSLLDGVRNVLPHGVPLALYQHSASLVDAYKLSELDAASGLGIYSLTSRISDRAEAVEELRANVVWGLGLPGAVHALSDEAVEAFRRGEAVRPQSRLEGRRGSYLRGSRFALAPRGAQSWQLAADAGRDHAQVAALRARLADPASLARAVDEALQAGLASLRHQVAHADGLQSSADRTTVAHHAANVLFNGMRGGFFAQHHDVPAADFARFVSERDRPAAAAHARLLAALPAWQHVDELRRAARAAGDPALERLVNEYLPLHFGRRHGDPSRPWNRFSIRVRDASGDRALRYEGNWRDIFQNWEALATSHPAFLPSMVARFVNASTVDGYNPYRIQREGLDWEVEEPGHPWSNIGYWGDHQGIYLLRLLELLRATRPGAVEEMLDRAVFSYADVPYRIAAIERLLADPRHTITFDHARAARIAERVRERGGDGRLLHDAAGHVVHVNLFEKLLVPVLTKLSNLVPEGGIWMNTQRPEWNDANNALVGNGVSVVSLAYLRRTLTFLLELLGPARERAFEISAEVADWARAVRALLEERPPGAGGVPADGARLQLLTALGGAFTDYREQVYEHGFRGRASYRVAEALALLHAALDHTDHALAANVRPDGLHHSYNLLRFQPEGRGVALERLPEMLEGQVAALASGRISPKEAVLLLDALSESALFRADQSSFMLQPERHVPGFLAKNQLPESGAANALVAALLEAGDTRVVLRDAAGVLRFAPGIVNAPALTEALVDLEREPRWSALVARERSSLHALHERVFQHHSFLGRSGTMYGYEGIGCIYWHMVAKLLLAVQEQFARAEREDAPASVRAALARHYDRIRDGLGFRKTPARYGAFPTDPYSHTPAGRGARQPGMTGQVKEEILTRLGELGVEFHEGCLAFRPRLLSRTEFLTEPARFECEQYDGRPQVLDLPAGSLAFTLATVPVVYRLGDGPPRITVHLASGTVREAAGETLGRDDSAAILDRTGGVTRVLVDVPAAELRAGEIG